MRRPLLSAEERVVSLVRAAQVGDERAFAPDIQLHVHVNILTQ